MNKQIKKQLQTCHPLIIPFSSHDTNALFSVEFYLHQMAVAVDSYVTWFSNDGDDDWVVIVIAVAAAYVAFMLSMFGSPEPPEDPEEKKRREKQEREDRIARREREAQFEAKQAKEAAERKIQHENWRTWKWNRACENLNREKPSHYSPGVDRPPSYDVLNEQEQMAEDFWSGRTRYRRPLRSFDRWDSNELPPNIHLSDDIDP